MSDDLRFIQLLVLPRSLPAYSCGEFFLQRRWCIMGNKGLNIQTWRKGILKWKSLFCFWLVLYFLFRIFWNSLLAYLLIYIDIVIGQPGLGPWNNRRYGLIIILMWGTSQVLIKLVLAVWHHIKFHLTCCYNTLEPGRKEKVDALWEGLNMEYKQIERMAIDKLSHTQIMQVASHPASKKRWYHYKWIIFMSLNNDDA